MTIQRVNHTQSGSNRVHTKPKILRSPRRDERRIQNLMAPGFGAITPMTICEEVEKIFT
jgi:hypothetical protein